MATDRVTTKMADHAHFEFDSRLHFLNWVICDTQETVRFLDTKAGFCVTLLSGMVAVSMEHEHPAPLVHHVLFPLFMIVAGFALLVSLRVIFPTIKPHGTGGKPASPKFFIGQNKMNNWVRHAVMNPSGNILSETPQSYVEAIQNCHDDDLAASMAETVVTLAFIRQLKSDRLHSAMFCLALTVLLFATVMLA